MGDPPDQRQRPRSAAATAKASVSRLADAAGENSGHAQHRQRDQDRIFVIAVEYLRRQQARKRSANHPAERGAKVKLRQPPRARPASIEFAMAHQRQERERDEIEGNHRHPEHLVPADQAHRERRHCERDKPDHIGLSDPWPFAKRGDEGEQVYRQRNHPQERRGSDIGRQIRRDRDNEAGRHRCKRNPAHPFNGTRANFVLRRGLRCDRCRARGEQIWRRPGAQRTAQIRRPGRGLRLQRQERLDDDGIGEQRGKRPEIGRGVEHVGITRLPVPTRGKPALQQRRAGRQREEWKADRDRKQSEQPERRTIRRRR